MATASPTPSLSPCTLQCVFLAATQNGCPGITDIFCLCTNSQFQADAGLCLMTHCTPADQAAAQALSEAQCSPGLTPTGPANPTPKPVSFRSSAASSTSTRTPVANTRSIIVTAAATSSTSSSSSTSGPPQATTSSPDTGTDDLDSELKIGLGVGLGIGLSGFFLLLFLSYKLYQRTESGRRGKPRHPDFDQK